MSSLVTSKEINVAQLSIELGEAPVRVTNNPEDDTRTVEAREVSQTQLETAIKSHVPDENFSPPPLPPTAEELAAISARTKLKALGLTDAEVDAL